MPSTESQRIPDTHSGICTFNMVHWDFLAASAQTLYNATASTWDNSYRSGTYNIIRILTLNDPPVTKVAVRVSRLPLDDPMGYGRISLQNRLSSEIATMLYLGECTTIPIPTILQCCLDIDGSGVGAPYIIMTHAAGEPIENVWQGMDDRHKDGILHQLAEAYLQLFQCKFDHICSLHLAPTLDDISFVTGRPVHPPGCEDDPIFIQNLEKCTPTTSQQDFWMSCINQRLSDILEGSFGSDTKFRDWSFMWFIRSLVDSDMYDPKTRRELEDGYRAVNYHLERIVECGFHLYPRDYHSQTILVDGDRITAILDWEYYVTGLATASAQYPPFMLVTNRNTYGDVDSARKRSRRDREIFDKFLREVVAEAGAFRGPHASDAFLFSLYVFNIEKVLQRKPDFDWEMEVLLDWMFPGYDIERARSGLENFMMVARDKSGGVWEAVSDGCVEEMELLREAKRVIGEDELSAPLSKADFIFVLLKYRRRLRDSDVLGRWLASELLRNDMFRLAKL